MTNLEKTKEILSLVVTAASAIVALSEIWAKVGPEVKKAIMPLIDGCKKIAEDNSKPDNSFDQEIKAIENK